jgi:hypothetical protein
LKLWVLKVAAAEAKAAAAAGSAALEPAGLPETCVAGALAPGDASPSVLQPATARATVAIMPRPSPANRGVRMSVLPLRRSSGDDGRGELCPIRSTGKRTPGGEGANACQSLVRDVRRCVGGR